MVNTKSFLCIHQKYPIIIPYHTIFFSTEDREIVEELIPNITNYREFISDPIKKSATVFSSTEKFSNFLTIYFKYFLKYPGRYIEAFLQNTRGFWFIDDTSIAEMYGKEKAFADSLNFDVRRYGDDWREVFVLWMYFKHENGKPYKTQTSVNAMMKQLHEIAGGDLQIAREVVEQSMANNYSGFFPLMKTKTQKNGTSYQGDSTLGEEFERKV